MRWAHASSHCQQVTAPLADGAGAQVMCPLPTRAAHWARLPCLHWAPPAEPTSPGLTCEGWCSLLPSGAGVP